MSPNDTVGERLCAYCGKPLPAEAHGNQTLHETPCKELKQLEWSRAYYRRNADRLRGRRRKKYVRADAEA